MRPAAAFAIIAAILFATWWFRPPEYVVDAPMRHEPPVDGRSLLSCIRKDFDRSTSYFAWVPTEDVDGYDHGDRCPIDPPGDIAPKR